MIQLNKNINHLYISYKNLKMGANANCCKQPETVLEQEQKFNTLGTAPEKPVENNQKEPNEEPNTCQNEYKAEYVTYADPIYQAVDPSGNVVELDSKTYNQYFQSNQQQEAQNDAQIEPQSQQVEQREVNDQKLNQQETEQQNVVKSENDENQLNANSQQEQVQNNNYEYAYQNEQNYTNDASNANMQYSTNVNVQNEQNAQEQYQTDINQYATNDAQQYGNVGENEQYDVNNQYGVSQVAGYDNANYQYDTSYAAGAVTGNEGNFVANASYNQPINSSVQSYQYAESYQLPNVNSQAKTYGSYVVGSY